MRFAGVLQAHPVMVKAVTVKAVIVKAVTVQTTERHCE